MIVCFHCKRAHAGCYKGSRAELKFMRLGTQEHSDKLFFCTPSCYLDYNVERAFRKRLDIDDMDPVDVAEARRQWYEEKYDQISSEVYQEYGFKQFLYRNGHRVPAPVSKAAALAAEEEEDETAPISRDWADL